MKTRLFCTAWLMALLFVACTKEHLEPTTPFSDRFDGVEPIYEPASFYEPQVEITMLSTLPSGEVAQNASDRALEASGCAYAPCELILDKWRAHYSRLAASTCEPQYACIACCAQGGVLYASMEVQPPGDCQPIDEVVKTYLPHEEHTINNPTK